MKTYIEHPGRSAPNRPIALLPSTRLGWWAVALAAGFVAFASTAHLVPRGAAFALACGLAGGIAALVAAARDGERAVTVMAALVPLVIAIGFFAAELLGG